MDDTSDKIALAVEKARRAKGIDEAMDLLMKNHKREEPASSPYNLTVIDTVLRPYLKVVANAHADKADPEEFAGIVEVLCSQIIIRLLRQTMSGAQVETRMQAAASLLQNIADNVLARAAQPQVDDMITTKVQ